MIISESEFKIKIVTMLNQPRFKDVNSVTGPGRSGAIAAVYASHILHIPFIPHGFYPLERLLPILIIDTATESGKTLKKSASKYKNYAHIVIAIYQEPPRISFWYESPKPQFYKHEDKK